MHSALEELQTIHYRTLKCTVPSGNDKQFITLKCKVLSGNCKQFDHYIEIHSALGELLTISYFEIHSALGELLTIPYKEMDSALR